MSFLMYSEGVDLEDIDDRVELVNMLDGASDAVSYTHLTLPTILLV